jgi:two-component system cell cycle sensor histidine kinase PleC
MAEVTAEMIERGRIGDPTAAAQRRRLASRMRQAREKLTSSGSGQRTFDLELLRIFAERHRAASPVMLGLAFGAAAVSLLWAPPIEVAVWAALLGLAVAGLAYRASAFLRDPEAPGQHVRWQRRFVLGELARGFAWAAVAGMLLNVADARAQTFALLMLLLAGAMSALLSACVPSAVFASLGPMTIAIVVQAKPYSGHASLPLLTLACGAQAFFLVLARRLYQTTLETLTVQAEKDALIVELEQARLNSDEARRRAEEASLAKSRFLATMSHELRTPLNAILGFSEVMKGELFGSHAVAAYRDYSNDIHSSGQHLLTLINEILDLSRVEAGRYELHEESIALAYVVEDCRHLLNLRADKRAITIVTLVEPELPRIWADERAIRQAILNLLSNAIKFTPQGGTVTIKVGWTAQGGQYVSIRDTGPGIPEDEIPIVMSSFGRGTLAQKNAEEGTGLGLPIVKGLIELHGGSFTLKSKVREGTEAVMILPPQRVISALPPMSQDAPVARRRGSGQRPAAA